MFFEFSEILSATQIVLSYGWVLPIGLVVGIVVGAIPGFSASNTLMMLLPMTMAMDIYPALIFMSAVYCGGNMGDSVPAVLINTPGSGGSVTTCFDGYPMAQKGLAQQALVISIIASAIGGLSGSVVALFLMSALGKVALKFKNAEMFVVVLFGLSLIAQLSSKNLAKGFLAGFLGLLIGAIGFDHMWSIPRATFGVLELYEGAPRIAAMVGLFAISESLIMVDRLTIAGEKQRVSTEWSGVKEAIRMAFKWFWGNVRSGLIGMVVGVLPGAGASIASFVSYQQAMNFSKRPEAFGSGIPEGVMASESANNGVTGGALVPLLTLGIPGSATTMVMLIVIQSHGMPIGPRLFETAPVLGYSVVIAMIFTYLIMSFVGLPVVYRLAKLTLFSTFVLAPIIISLTMIGAFAERAYYVDMVIAMIFGVIGYFMKKTGYPPHAAILGIILGPMVEHYFLLSMRLTNNSPTTFFRSGISITLWVLLFVTLLGPMVYKKIKAVLKTN